MAGRYLLILLIAIIAAVSSAHKLHRPFANHGDLLHDYMQEHRHLAKEANCGLLQQAFSQPPWENSTCSCKNAPGSSDEVVATCIDNFECCSSELSVNGMEICVTNSFQQVIDRATFGALDTTEYFHYTAGRMGTITLFHLGNTCSLHVDRTRCMKCEVINCGADDPQPMFDCTNVPGGGVFDYCPGEGHTVTTLDTHYIIGALQDGFINFEFPFVEGQGGCRMFPDMVVPKLGGLHDLMGQHSAAISTRTASVAAIVASTFFGILFL